MSRYYDSSSSFRRRRTQEEVDPMSSMANMADVMLVFACGLMVALVMAWNVDLDLFREVETDQELSKDEVTEITEQMNGEGNGFVQMGTVYQDPVTGKYYLVEGGEGASSGDGSGNADASGSSSASNANSGSSSAANGSGNN